MSREIIAAHVRRWAALPTLPMPGGVQMPAHDGDMATLDELADRIFDELDDAYLDGRSVRLPTREESFYWEERHMAGLSLLAIHYWPDDRAAEQLACWRAQLDGIA